jgi:L-ascorbate metabolism protein UlaG (beta-lactamase superfamily)
MQLEWFGQSAFRLMEGATTVVIDPFGDVSWLVGQGLQAETPVVDLAALPDGDGPLLVLPAAP